MSNDLKTPAEAAPPRIGMAGTLARFALIGVALAAVAGTFAYLGGWFTPNELTPARFADGFEQVNGIHSGFRRNHAKGVCASGYIESNGNGVRLSKALVCREARVPVIGRFSLGVVSPMRPTRRVRCAVWGFSFPCRTANCGEPR
jgi:catalase